MNKKTSTEIQEIFGLGRDDIRRLERDGVLNPVKSGQGKASLFGEEDLWNLLDIKMYLTAGYRISDMKTIITDDYDSDESLSMQIRLYKKRIQLLEFIGKLKSYVNEFRKLKKSQLFEICKITAKKANMPSYGTNEYFEGAWNYIKLIFIADFMSQKESLMEKDDAVTQKRVFTAFKTGVEILRITGMEVNYEKIIENLKEIAANPIENEEEIKDFIQNIVDEYLSNKEEIINDLITESAALEIEGVDTQARGVLEDFYKDFVGFIFDYFIREEELYYLYLNFRKFINGLDKQALSNGIVRLGGEK